MKDALTWMEDNGGTKKHTSGGTRSRYKNFLPWEAECNTEVDVLEARYAALYISSIVLHPTLLRGRHSWDTYSGGVHAKSICSTES